MMSSLYLQQGILETSQVPLEFTMHRLVSCAWMDRQSPAEHPRNVLGCLSLAELDGVWP